MTVEQLRESLEEKRLSAETRLIETELAILNTLHESWDQFQRIVDPREYLYDDGENWVGMGRSGVLQDRTGFDTEGELQDAREQCRVLAMENGFAINGHENRISYVVGTGHAYRASKKEDSVSDELVKAAQMVLDDFWKANKWLNRQQESMRRYDRDGEAIIRFFEGSDGILRTRFVEPNLLTSSLANSDATFGIETDPDDVETPLVYYIDGEPVQASEIQHRKANVDLNVKRGVPTFWPVRHDLRRAARVVLNMAALTTTQSSIAMIRKVAKYAVGSVRAFADAKKDYTFSNNATGETTRGQIYRPGTVLTANEMVDYEFPGFQVNAAAFVEVIQGILRVIASRLVMPEFMFTSDASNANYSSTMVAEGPAVKMFQRLQADMMAYDMEIMERVLRISQKLPDNVLEMVTVEATPPNLISRNQLEDARKNQILKQEGVLSVQTWSEKEDLEYDSEQKKIKEHIDLVGDDLQTGLLGKGEDDETSGNQ